MGKKRHGVACSGLAAVTTHQRTRPLLRPLACAAWLPRPHTLELVHPTVAHRHLHVRRRAQAWGLSLRRRAQVGGGRGPGRGHSTCRLVPAMTCCGLRNSATIPDSASNSELFNTHTHTQPHTHTHSHTATQPHSHTHTHTHTRARARALTARRNIKGLASLGSATRAAWREIWWMLCTCDRAWEGEAQCTLVPHSLRDDLDATVGVPCAEFPGDDAAPLSRGAGGVPSDGGMVLRLRSGLA